MTNAPFLKNYLIFVYLFLIGLAAYINTLSGGFVWDDIHIIENNPLIKDMAHIPQLFLNKVGAQSTGGYSFYRPLLMATFSMDYALFGLNAFGYHLTTIILHVIASFMVFQFINYFFNHRSLALLTSFLFLVHPIQTEDVAYITGRADSLVVIFLLGALILFNSCNRWGKPSSLALFCMALLTKETAVMFPALIVLCLWYKKKRLLDKRLIPFVLLCITYVIARFSFSAELTHRLEDSSALHERLPGFFAALSQYGRLLIMPKDLHMEYPNQIFSTNDPQVISGIFLVSVIIFFFYYVKRKNIYHFFILWFFISISPVSNVFFPASSYMAERYLYMPSIGYFLFLSHIILYLYVKTKFKKILLGTIFIIIGLYFSLTVLQNRTWSDAETFYKRTLRYAPHSYRLYGLLADMAYKRGDLATAIIYYTNALRINPNYANGYANCIPIFKDMGHYDKAILSAKRAIEIDPYHVAAYNNLGTAYRKKGEIENAIKMYEKTIMINPHFALGYYNLAILYYIDLNDYDKAAHYTQESIKRGIKPHPELLKLIRIQ